MTRLHSNYPVLADQILSSPSDAVRRIVGAAAHIALANSGLQGELLEAALASVDGTMQLGVRARERLLELQEEWDGAYLDIQDGLNADQPLPPEAVKAFRQARAIAAVLGAVDECDAARAAEVVYEALASSADPSGAARTIADVTFP